jgi:hypothetical protein
MPRVIFWRNWLVGATGEERLILCDLETRAKKLAVEGDCYNRLVGSASLVADCSDIHVARFRGKWGRSRGNLYCNISVITGPERQLYTFRWRKTMRRR